LKDILIIDCGPSLTEVTKVFGSAPEWIMNCLNETKCNFTWIKPYDGDQIGKKHYDAWIITGSPRSVYENEDWMFYIEEELRLIKFSDTLVLGICFGSQLIAKAFGGKVQLNPNGWELGAYSIELTDIGKQTPLFLGFANNEIVYESHQDCITQLPDDAIELAKNKKGNQSFTVYNNFYGVQFHPEFSLDIIKKYVSIRKAKGVPVDDPSIPESINGKLILFNFIKLIK
tara:strand:- start:496 stop:1182 length:687 start_codon:yes stop_codon:yes gene_type:complete